MHVDLPLSHSLAPEPGGRGGGGQRINHMIPVSPPREHSACDAHSVLYLACTHLDTVESVAASTPRVRHTCV